MLKRRVRPKMGVREETHYRSHTYEQWIRGFDCLVMGKIDPCQGKVQPAHVRTGTDGSASKKPSDWWLIPLCVHHHIHTQHRIGEPEFERRYGIDMKAEAKKLWNSSTHKRKYDAKSRR